MTDELQIVAPDPQTHRRNLYDLTAKCFSGHEYWEWQEFCRDGYFENGFYDWRTSRIALIGRTMVTHCGVWDYAMRIGSRRVRVAGVGAVATHGEFRQRGLMDRTVRASLDAMVEGGYDMTMLSGIRDYYDRFGYVRAWSGSVYIVSTIDLPSDRQVPRIHRFTYRADTELDALYNHSSAALTGTAVRPTFKRNPRPKIWRWYRWAKGYVVVNSGRGAFALIDCAGDPRDVLTVLGRLARRYGAKEVRITGLHHDSALARELRRGNCRREQNYIRSGGPMVRTVNLRSLLTKITGELHRRMKGSALIDWRGELKIADGREEVTLLIDRAKVKVAPHPVRTPHTVRGKEEIAQLLIGTDAPDDLVATAGTRLTGTARKLITILFPHQHPMLSTWDHY